MKNQLTTRQFQVAELYIWAGRKKAVAAALGVSVDTVNNTLKRVYERLDIYSEELTAYYMVHVLGVDVKSSPIEKYPQISGCESWGQSRRGLLQSLVGALLLVLFSIEIVNYTPIDPVARTANRSTNRTAQRGATARGQRCRRTEIDFYEA